MQCSVFKNDEAVAGWRDGQSVAYCKRCFQEKMERETLSNVNAECTGMETQHPSNQQDSLKRFAFSIY